MHELAILHLLVDLGIEPLVLEHPRDVLEADPGQSEGALNPAGILGRGDSILHNFEVDLP